MDRDFNARTSAEEREYRYMLWGEGLDVTRMKDASMIFPGVHDFRNFADEEKEKSTLSDIKRILIEAHGNWIFLDIAASRFLMHMVRKIAASLKLIGKGEKDKEWLNKMLDCTMAERLEPLDASSLILMNVKYPGMVWNIDAYARDRALEEIHELFMGYEVAARVMEEFTKFLKI